MSAQRAKALHGTWERVNEIATTTEDSATIRALIAEAGIDPGAHVRVDADAFTPVMVAEWVLGQGAGVIDANHLWGLNSGRNVSLHQFDLHAASLLDPEMCDRPLHDDEQEAQR